MRILFVSDFHYLKSYKKNNAGYKSIFNEMENSLKTLKDILLSTDYDLLLIGGDLCEDGMVEDYQSVKDTLDKYNKKPYLITLGNHDIKENFYKVFTKTVSKNKYHYTKEFNNYKFISFDSSLHGVNDGHINSEDSEWLINEIENSDQEVIVLTHHHLLNYQHETKSVGISDQLLSALKNKQVKIVFSAHTHTPYFQKFDHTNFITTGSLSFRAHSENNNNLVFDNERYYTLIDVNNYVGVNHINIKGDYKQYQSFDLNKDEF